MKLKSMRVRLPLTYAAIALLTALALGGVLILTLQDYYTQRERLYLIDRATAIQAILNKTIEAGLPPKALEAQVRSLAFFTQARVRFLDNGQNVLANSGDPTQGDVFSVLPLASAVDLKGGSVRVIQSITGPPPVGPGPAPIGGQTESQPVPAEPPNSSRSSMLQSRHGRNKCRQHPVLFSIGSRRKCCRRDGPADRYRRHALGRSESGNF